MDIACVFVFALIHLQATNDVPVINGILLLTPLYFSCFSSKIKRVERIARELDASAKRDARESGGVGRHSV